MSADRWITDYTVSRRYPVYTRANAGEVLPDPVSPLTATTTWVATNEGWRDAQINVGTCAPDEVDATEVTGIFGGYLYINASLARLFGVRGPDMTAEMIDFTYFGDHPDVPPYVAEDWHESPENTAKMATWMQAVLIGRPRRAARGPGRGPTESEPSGPISVGSPTINWSNGHAVCSRPSAGSSNGTSPSPPAPRSAPGSWRRSPRRWATRRSR